MHVLHRPHLPRLTTVSIVAATLTIALMLAFAGALSAVSQTGNNAGAPASVSAPAVSGVPHPNAPRWVSSPFASLLSRPLPLP